MRPDGELLSAYSKQGSEEAFAELVRRHGPMVEAVCRRRLGADAEDAFQAVFVLLARKAANLVKRRELGPWLHRACGFVARSTVRERARRRHHEKEAGDMKEASAAPARAEEIGHAEIATHIDDAVSSLPERFRRVVVLCYLEGATQEQAATRLKLPLGTVAWRCSRGLEKLRARLRKRGVALGAAALGSLLLEGASHATQGFSLLPSALAAPKIAAAGAVTGSAGLPLAIAEGAMKMMLWAKMTKLAAGIAIAVLAIGCAGAPLVVSSLSASRPERRSVADFWVVDAPPPPSPANTPLERPKPASEADLVLRLRCTAVTPLGRKKKYTLQVLEVLKGDEFAGSIELTVPGSRPGTIEFLTAALEKGSVRLNARMKELLAEAGPGLEFTVGIDLRQVDFTPTRHKISLLGTAAFAYQAEWADGKPHSIRRFKRGQRVTIPGQDGTVSVSEQVPDPFDRENIEQLEANVMKGLRSREAKYHAKGLEVDRLYVAWERSPGDTSTLTAAVNTLSEYGRQREALTEAIEEALRNALGASYSRPVSVGSLVVNSPGGTRKGMFSVNGVNRPLREYAAKVGARFMAVDDRLGHLRVSAETVSMPTDKLAELLARKVGARVIKRDNVWHIVPGEGRHKQRF